MRSSLAVAPLALLVLAGCGRKHLSPAFGQATRAAFAAQPANPKPGAPVQGGLDTQEAEVVAKTYVKSLAGETRVAEPDPVVFVAPQRGSVARPPPIAPSVPKE
jgi:hypothetical protein